jgi:hypothetical protein
MSAPAGEVLVTGDDVLPSRTSDLMRELNRVIRSRSNGEDPHEPTDFFCECVQRDCFAEVTRTLVEFDLIERDVSVWLVAETHTAPDTTVKPPPTWT